MRVLELHLVVRRIEFYGVLSQGEARAQQQDDERDSTTNHGSLLARLSD
jgi:hypothetical protein